MLIYHKNDPHFSAFGGVKSTNRIGDLIVARCFSLSGKRLCIPEELYASQVGSAY